MFGMINMSSIVIYFKKIFEIFYYNPNEWINNINLYYKNSWFAGRYLVLKAHVVPRQIILIILL